MPEVKRKPRAAGGGEGDVAEDKDTREGPARSGCAGTFYVRAQLFLPPAPLRLSYLAGRGPPWEGHHEQPGPWALGHQPASPLNVLPLVIC